MIIFLSAELLAYKIGTDVLLECFHTNFHQAAIGVPLPELKSIMSSSHIFEN